MSSLIARATLVLTGVLALAAAPSAGSAGQADRPSQGRAADEWVTTQIQAKYFLDRDIKARTIDVTTINGNVTLSGQVNSAQERERASDIAARIPGVRNVDNRLTWRATRSPPARAASPRRPPAATFPARTRSNASPTATR